MFKIGVLHIWQLSGIFKSETACEIPIYMGMQQHFAAHFFLQIANEIFRWQICYLLLLISNPEYTARMIYALDLLVMVVAML